MSQSLDRKTLTAVSIFALNPRPPKENEWCWSLKGKSESCGPLGFFPSSLKMISGRNADHPAQFFLFDKSGNSVLCFSIPMISTVCFFTCHFIYWTHESQLMDGLQLLCWLQSKVYGHGIHFSADAVYVSKTKNLVPSIKLDLWRWLSDLRWMIKRFSGPHKAEWNTR